MNPTGHRSHDVLDSPVGELTLLAVDGVLGGIYMTDHLYRPPLSSSVLPIACRSIEARQQLIAYSLAS